MTYNTWLRKRPHNLAGVIDFDRVVRNPSTVNTLDSDYNYGDGTHILAGGLEAQAAAMPERLRRTAA